MTSKRIDPFTSRRITRFVEEFRKSQGQLPTLQDFEKAGFARPAIDQAVRDGILELFYVNLSNGPVVKGYKIKAEL